MPPRIPHSRPTLPTAGEWEAVTRRLAAGWAADGPCVAAFEDLEELGPFLRRLAVHYMLLDRDVIMGSFFVDVEGVQRRTMSAAYPAVRRAMTSNLEIDDESVMVAFGKLRHAGERFQAELQPSGYLVGDGFTVADLTLAALLSPAVAPPEFPYRQPQRDHPNLAPLREALDEHGLADWTRGIYTRHRGRSAEVAA